MNPTIIILLCMRNPLCNECKWLARYIKLSSPRLNNMAVVGCVLVYTAVILLGLDHATLPTKAAFPTVCTVPLTFTSLPIPRLLESVQR